MLGDIIQIDACIVVKITNAVYYGVNIVLLVIINIINNYFYLIFFLNWFVPFNYLSMRYLLLIDHLIQSADWSDCSNNDG